MLIAQGPAQNIELAALGMKNAVRDGGLRAYGLQFLYVFSLVLTHLLLTSGYVARFGIMRWNWKRLRCGAAVATTRCLAIYASNR